MPTNEIKTGKKPVGIEVAEGSQGYDSPEPSYRTRYRLLESLTTLVGTAKVNGLLVVGDPGIGKTTTVLNTLTNLGLTEGNGFVVYKGHTSPLGIYQTLFAEQQTGNRGIIIFDDCDTALGKDGVNIIKASLDNKEKRVVSFVSSKLPAGIPTQFTFEGRIIFISNIPLTKLDEAVADRCLSIEIALSREELYAFIRNEVLKHDYLATNIAQRSYVLRRMQAALNKSQVKASVRLYFKLLQLWSHDRSNFDLHLAQLLPKADDLAVLRHLLNKYDTVKDAAEAYAARYGKSTRSFYLLKAKYRDLL